ncbi:MAG: hypothetical protein ACKO6M_07975, partial [Bacteroidota bacterium]
MTKDDKQPTFINAHVPSPTWVAVGGSSPLDQSDAVFGSRPLDQSDAVGGSSPLHSIRMCAKWGEECGRSAHEDTWWP